MDFTMVDLVILGILVAAIFIGWARGFINVLIGFVSFAAAAIIAGRYADTVVSWLNKAWGLQDKLAAVVERRIAMPPEADKIPIGSIPWEKAVTWMKDVPIPGVSKEALAHHLAKWSQAGSHQTPSSFIAHQLANGMLAAAVFVVLTALVGWLLVRVGRLVSGRVNDIPLIGTANQALGAAVTGLEAAVGLALVVGFVIPALSMYGPLSLGHAVQNAKLTPYLLSLFEAIRGLLFGLPGGHFFVT